MEFLFECLTQYLISESSKRVRNRVEHSKRNYTCTRAHMCYLVYYIKTKGPKSQEKPALLMSKPDRMARKASDMSAADSYSAFV